MEKIIEIDGQKVNMKATAATPRKYRIMFRRDIMSDMVTLSKSLKNAESGEAEFSRMDLEIFENVAFIMAKQGGSKAADIDEWLDNFKMFDIYTVLPQILEMWNIETETLIDSKKNLQKVIGS